MTGRRVHRMGDPNSAGGRIDMIPQGSVWTNNLLTSVDSSRGTSHPCCPAPGCHIHCYHVWQTANGRRTVYAENIPINCEGDSDTCGHPRAAGSPNVFAEDINWSAIGGT